MAVTIDQTFLDKANRLKRPLKVKTVYPQKTVAFVPDAACFQHIRVDETGPLNLPCVLNSGDKLLLDFGDHYVGYLHFALENHGIFICDSPLKLKFSFGEFPYEIQKPFEEYRGALGCGWFQREEKIMPFMPVNTQLERRYAFRYLLIERTDNGRYAVELKELFAQTVSAVDLDDALPVDIPDAKLRQIYAASVKTLKECEQTVFEDGPKRDRRLWLGDLRVQALTDYKTFKNYDLVKRCLYLFASCTTDSQLMAPCFFEDSAPYIDDHFDSILVDYCLFFTSCLYDYYQECRDTALLAELYEVACRQFKVLSARLDKATGQVDATVFIDWCEGLDKQVAFLGVYLYTLRQLKFITAVLEKDTAWIDAEIATATTLLLGFYDQQKGLFIPSSGQISQHSQIWAVLSGVLPPEQNRALANKIEGLQTEFTLRTPFAVHYYLEALYTCGLKQKAIDKIVHYWGKLLDCGYDCFPECFNENDDFASPYNAPEINSACHAWSCTPAYWIYRYINE